MLEEYIIKSVLLLLLHNCFGHEIVFNGFYWAMMHEIEKSIIWSTVKSRKEAKGHSIHSTIHIISYNSGSGTYTQYIKAAWI